MDKILFSILIASIFFQPNYYGSTTAPVIIAGGIIKSKHSTEVDQKYKRKDCPVCKGKGWYMSGDGIKKIECNYCEPDNKDMNHLSTIKSGTSCSSNQCTIIKKK